MTAARAHPARYSDAHVLLFERLLNAETYRRPGERLRVLDPMAGVGGIHALDQLQFETTAVELEAPWCEVARQLWPNSLTIHGDATALSFADGHFDAVVVSPTFGNRLRDRHANRDLCKLCAGTGQYGGSECSRCWGRGVSLRRSYTHDVRRVAGDDDYILADTNTGVLSAKTERYWELHETAWAEALRVLRPDGLMLLDVKGQVERKRQIPVVAGHRKLLAAVGFTIVAERPVAAAGLRNGSNREMRVAAHTVIVARKPAAEAEVAA